MLGRNHSTHVVIVLIVAATLIAAPGANAASSMESVVIGGQKPAFTFSPSITPRELPRAKPSPVKLGLLSQFFPVDEIPIYPPALGQVKILLDRHLELQTRGLPACGGFGLQVYPSVPVPERCKEAAVGAGRVSLTIAFPESKAISLDLKVHIYNGGTRSGVTRLWLYFPITVPVPTSILAPIEIRKVDRGPFGTEALIIFPKIAGGSGFITQLWLNINREYEFKDQRRTVAAFRCANDKFQSSAEASFLDGSTAAAEALRLCVAER